MTSLKTYRTTEEFLKDTDLFAIKSDDYILTPADYPREVLDLLVPSVTFPLGTYSKFIDLIDNM
jgi:hypothetical protein